MHKYTIGQKSRLMLLKKSNFTDIKRDGCLVYFFDKGWKVTKEDICFINYENNTIEYLDSHDIVVKGKSEKQRKRKHPSVFWEELSEKLPKKLPVPPRFDHIDNENVTSETLKFMNMLTDKGDLDFAVVCGLTNLGLSFSEIVNLGAESFFWEEGHVYAVTKNKIVSLQGDMFSFAAALWFIAGGFKVEKSFLRTSVYEYKRDFARYSTKILSYKHFMRKIKVYRNRMFSVYVKHEDLTNFKNIKVEDGIIFKEGVPSGLSSAANTKTQRPSFEEVSAIINKQCYERLFSDKKSNGSQIRKRQRRSG